MESAGLLLREKRESTSKQPARIREATKWTLLGRFGWILGLIGLTDLLLVWYPPAFGNAGWEFATIDRSFSAVPLFTVGLAAVMVAAWARARTVQVRLIAWLMIVAALLMAAGFVLFLLNAPIAVQMAGDVSTGVKKAIVKTTLVAVVLTAGFLAVSISALRTLSSLGKAGSDE